jgi:hypothetical protein
MPDETIRIRQQPKQRWLYDAMRATGPDVPTVIGFGGAKGGGKSKATQDCSVLLALTLGATYPGIKITIIRRVYDDLKQNHIDPLRLKFPQLESYYRSGDKEFAFSVAGGSKIIFAYAETEEDVRRKFLGGYESAFILVDEAQQFSQQELQWIMAAARWTGSDGIPAGLCKVVLLFNPGGKGSSFLRRVFWLKQYEGKERPGNYAFMHVFGWDNYEWFRGQADISEHDFYNLASETRFQMFITETSEGRKYDAFPLSIRAGYLLGSFDHFEGQYFAGAWDAQKCVLTRDRVAAIAKPWWTRWMAQDWGFGDHDAHGWFTIGKLSPSEWVKHFGGHTDSAMDVCILYRENIVAGRAEADLANDIVALTPQHERRYIERFFLSQDAFGQKARQRGANTVGEQFTNVMRAHGLPAPETADQDRVNGWRFVYNGFRQAQLAGTMFGDERARQGPAVFISSECPNTIESIPMAIRDDHKIEDVARVEGVLWEDCCDMVRYGLKSMLASQWEAPLEVRRREVYDSYDAPERTGEQMTALSLAMLRFDSEEKKRGQRVKRRR